MRTKLRIGFVLVLLFTPVVNVIAEEPVCVKGACFERARPVGPQVLPLLGAALKRYLIFDVYSAALYGPADARTPEAILADVPKRLEFQYQRDIDTKTMITAADEILRRNPALDLSQLAERLQKINASYQDVKEGDRYAFEYVPGEGSRLYLNGQLVTSIPGADFARAYFGIWLSRYPLSEGLRDQLLSSNRS